MDEEVDAVDEVCVAALDEVALLDFMEVGSAGEDDDELTIAASVEDEVELGLLSVALLLVVVRLG